MSSKLDQALDDAIKERRSHQRSNNSRRQQQQQSRLGSFERRITKDGTIRKRISTGSNINSRLGSSFRTAGGPQRQNRRGRSFGGKRSTDQPWSHDLFTGGERNVSTSSIESRLGKGRQQQQRRFDGHSVLLVENIHYNVTEQDLEEVFKLVGTVERCKIEFDRSGRSTGVAKVTFNDRNVALKAMDKFNNVDLDGQPMKISLLDKSSNNNNNNSKSSRQNRGNSSSSSNNATRNASDLDAELEAYTSGTTNKQNDDDDAMMLD
ncbi:uncharacterized protein BX664DRAFT_320613 [Halteromyces radiatus]|uniref:uncharacterized protein n=1 Tax=Halteromyces radiatus TaxID=101107 RepID=UPI0022202989|nr:uncharacterized protein BX664DRAFT_320613 [Halteromyces radiatus]KAI8099190.1 hypothetical protein BX664DRAFT_320613 [Halteromyces radiatus]